jgi:hypothetical protein
MRRVGQAVGLAQGLAGNERTVSLGIERLRIDLKGKRGSSFTVKLLPLRSGFVGGNYLCGSPKERWLRTARVEFTMHCLNAGRHTLKALSPLESLCNWRLRELPVAAALLPR